MKTLVLLIAGLLSFQLLPAQNPLLIKQVNGTNLTPGESGSNRFYKHQQWNNKFFYSCNGTTNLCVTDGTTAGTQNIYAFTVPAGGILANILFLGPAQDFMYFRYRVQYAAVAGVTPLDEQIWKTDGTTAGTQLVYSTSTTTATSPLVFSNLASDPSRPASIIGNTLFFRNITPEYGPELWKTDGTTAGTVLVKDIRPGTTGSGPVNFGNIGNKVLFYAGDGVVGRELWSTDGTEAGTVLVKDINPDNSSGGTSPNSGSDFLQGETGVCNGKYFFYANVLNTYGAEPWVSDGTEAGTFILKDIAPGTANSNVTVNQADFLPNDEYMFFRVKNLTTTSGTGAALWRSDGTTSGTIMLSIADTLSIVAATATAGGNKFMMLFNNGQSSTSARQYFLISDGSIAGTKTVDTGFFNLGNPIIYKNAGYCSGARGVSVGLTSYDNEVFRTDGTKPGSGIALDIFPGTVTSGSILLYNSGTPQKFFVLNNYLYFFARNTSTPFWGLFRYNGDFTFNNTLANNRWRDSSNWNSMLPPGITDTAYINGGIVNVEGRNAYAGRLEVQSGATINLTAATDSLFIHQDISAPAVTGNGTLVLRNFFEDTVNIRTPLVAGNIMVNGAATSSANVTVNNQLALATGARFMAGNSRITMAGTTSQIINAANSYIVTDGDGSLYIENVGTGGRTGSVLFPIGTVTNYNPVTIVNSGVADAFGARVRPGIRSNYTGDMPSGSAYTTGAVDATWLINELVAGGSNATVGLQWSASQELSGFDRTQSRLGHFVGGSWDLGDPGAASGTNPYSWTGSNITSFSPFGILNNNLTLPAQRIDLNVRKSGNGNVCNWIVTATDVQTVILEASRDGLQFQSIQQSTQVMNGIYTDMTFAMSRAYYRVKAITSTGRNFYSNIVLVNSLLDEQVQVYPTLFSQSFTVQNNSTGMIRLLLVGVDGRMMLSKELLPGTNVIEAGKLGRGVYAYSLIQNGTVISTGKLVRQ